MSATRSFFIGKVPIGGGAPVSVQSMTNTDSRDAAATLPQIRELAQAGCDIVRLSVYDEDCLKALPAIVDGSPVPLVADIHFRADLAVGAIERGVAKVRINPGNIGGMRKGAPGGGLRPNASCAHPHRRELRQHRKGYSAPGGRRDRPGHAGQRPEPCPAAGGSRFS